MFAKTILALVLAGFSLSFVANASAATKRSHYQPEQYRPTIAATPPTPTASDFSTWFLVVSAGLARGAGRFACYEAAVRKGRN